MDQYGHICEGGFREDYRHRLMWKGEDIFIISGDNRTPCRLIDVDEECRLEVELENGTRKLISAGEISIRRAEGTDPA
jgi:BirA family biotin operon repressor/biotin-[acetyl-CoA-carboxylase] ligase